MNALFDCFFPTGCLDSVKCFFCDGGLRNWSKTDIPWVEHAIWYPDCEFVKLLKGEGFVKTAIDQVINFDI